MDEILRRRSRQTVDGIYTKKLDSLPGNVIRHPQEGNWIRVNYTGRILNTGNIFVTRDSATAQLQGTFQYYTHYVPEYFQFKSDNGSVPSGMLYALGEMNAGDVVRAYIPYGLAYGTSGTSFGSGYEGQVASVPGSTPIIIDMELLEIVADPVIAENELVQDFAYNEGQDDRRYGEGQHLPPDVEFGQGYGYRKSGYDGQRVLRGTFYGRFRFRYEYRGYGQKV